MLPTACRVQSGMQPLAARHQFMAPELHVWAQPVAREPGLWTSPAPPVNNTGLTSSVLAQNAPRVAPCLSTPPCRAPSQADEDEEIYETYTPARLAEGKPHPDVIVETASLASVKPPAVTYEHHLQVRRVRWLPHACLGHLQTGPVAAGQFMGDGFGLAASVGMHIAWRSPTATRRRSLPIPSSGHRGGRGHIQRAAGDGGVRQPALQAEAAWGRALGLLPGGRRAGRPHAG